jgi:type VI secretion system secreted protein Hcp
MKKVYVLACVLLLTAAVVAESPHSENAKAAASHSIIVVKLNGLSCTTTAGTNMFDALAWSWGASNSGSFSTGGGAGAGKANIQDLSVSKKFDQCSPKLFGAVTLGSHLKDVTLTQEDGKGNILLTVTMTEVLVSSWSIGGAVNDELPMENVTFAFAKVCIADASTSTQACFDKTTNAGI